MDVIFTHGAGLDVHTRRGEQRPAFPPHPRLPPPGGKGSHHARQGRGEADPHEADAYIGTSEIAHYRRLTYVLQSGSSREYEEIN